MANHIEEDNLNTESATNILVSVNNISAATNTWNQVYWNLSIYVFFFKILLYLLILCNRRDTNHILHRSTASDSLYIWPAFGSDRRLMSWLPV